MVCCCTFDSIPSCQTNSAHFLDPPPRIKPIQYEVLSEKYSQGYQNIETTGKFVRHLLSTSPNRIKIQEVLPYCPFIENLAAWEPSSNILGLVTALPLRRLSIRLDCLFDGARPDFRHHPFPHLTHLEILEEQASWSHIEEISLLESLTHLSFYEGSERDVGEGALKHCKKLRVLILMDGDPGGWVKALPESEVRVVVYPDNRSSLAYDWDAGTMGGDDFWARADVVVAQRLAHQGP